MRDTVVITPQEVLELRHGLKQVKGTVKNARRLDSALERASTDLDNLTDPARELLQLVDGQPTEGSKGFRITSPLMMIARIAARLRHGKVAKKVAEAEQIELAHDDAAAQLTVIESLGRKVGVQLDLIDHGQGEPDEDEDG